MSDINESKDAVTQECTKHTIQKQYNILDILDILDKDKNVCMESRTNLSFYLRPSVAEAFRFYARLDDKSVGDCIEGAFIEYMVNHPVEGVKLEVQNIMTKENLRDVQRRLEIDIICENIEGCLRIFNQLKADGSSNAVTWRLKIIEALGKAVYIKNPPEKLVALLEQVEACLFG